MNKNYLEATKEVLAEYFGVEEDTITPETDLEKDLGLDSLDTLELVMDLEDRYGIDIPDSDSEKFKTVAEIVTYLQSRFTNE